MIRHHGGRLKWRGPTYIYFYSQIDSGREEELTRHGVTVGSKYHERTKHSPARDPGEECL